ncbi:MAG: simple sugar transport system ATP-binding protein [Pseudonocardiales bacterium]|jgi:simple sugar transport system ATP-binding protein|nr:putative transporter ATP-binding protein [Pseudonocardia sp.]MDT7650834.1 simple sugar transport system ATP-binding protein [Pseudonocardiales bacterium]
MPEALVTLRDISMEFAGVHALDHVTVSIARGEVCCLVGENGSGKSTLIKILAGVHAPSSGEIVIEGVSHDALRPADAIDAGIQVIYQDFSLFPHLTVSENIAFSSQIVGSVRRFRRAKAREAAAEVLERMRVRLDLDALVQDLPMVDRQLIAIAGALARDARLIVMDEPTTALSRKEVSVLLDIILGLKAEGVSTLFVSHKLDEVAAISDHTVVIRNGVKVADQPATEFNRHSLVTAMTGREIEFGAHALAPVDESNPTLLSVRGAGRPGCFSEVDLTLRAGEILGITGLLGSGRDTLALSLFGLLPMTSGEVVVDGRPATLDSPRAAMRQGIGFVPEDRLTEGLFLEHSIAANIIVRTVKSLRNRWGLLDTRRAGKLAKRWVDELRIKTPDVTRAVSTLSGGNQQRVVLAKWLSADPKILILNGPTVGVDVGSKSEILALLRELAGNGMGIIVISDDVPELLEVCHRLVLMRDGRVAHEFDRRGIDEQRLNELLMAA